ncbi:MULTISPECIES: TIR domain-containing protein [Cyanophyceae]|uniref:nSTAND1 domain-containing NTPase n=1 Tax=Cyanophyceae TaxID=3028117 RepID=UPI001688E2A9|nr:MULTISPECIES: TIR domain-containing protein [Cyanophyceae]MBD1917544.1 TIR domain-containing protein [Phormidium sp. FACHB-77]MBD2029581.1 TIR domain-containing protein [Phormidium sp. FACHB-322]MBD2050842.1 TIR domain-containing protein [Leptolyngbya sp. FACHB-60]
MAAPPRIFICYARSDNAGDDHSQRWLDRLLQMLGPLELRGLVKAWADNDVEPGEDWHRTIQASLDQAVAAVLLVSPAFLASEYIYNSELPVLLKNAQQRGVVILPLIVRPSLYDAITFKYPDSVQGPEEIALASIQAVNPVSHPLTAMTQTEQDETLLKLAHRLKAIVESQPPSPPPPEPEPYQGLRAFTAQTREFFFGREAEVQELIDKLAGANFVPVIGNSGSGKSSVVRAGLMPWATSQGWHVLGPIKPGIDPMPKLKASFEDVFNNREIRAIYDQIDTEGLMGVLDRLPHHQRYLLVVDQFEEVFTVCTNKDHRQQFIASLTGLGQHGDAPLKVVTTMRSDFVPQWLSSNPLTRVIQRHAVWLGPLLGEPLVEAIVRPAQTLGYNLENGLLELILDDVAQEENCLPLLEFALAELWQQRDTRRRVLTVAAHRNLGRLRGALAQRAETIYNHTLKSDLERQWCRHLCLELVRIGPEGTDTRSRQPRASLLGQHRTAKEQEVFDQVLETLVEERLLVADNDILDLTHEALMAGWPRFATWRDENRDQLRLVQRLKDAYTEWLAKDGSDAYLVQGGLLAELRDSWGALKTEAKLAAGLIEFFSLSDDHEQQKVAALEKALAEAELRAECSRIANLPAANAVDKTLLTIKAVADSLNTLQGKVITPVQDALHRAFTHPCERLRIIEGHGGLINSVAFSPKGDRIVAGGNNRTLRLWDLDGRQIGGAFEGHSGTIWSMAFSPRGGCIVSGGEDGTLRLWDLNGRQIGGAFEGHSNGVLSVAFSPGGDRIVSGSSDRTLRLWDLDGYQIGGALRGHDDAVRSVAFNRRGDCIVSGGNDGTLRLWDLAGRQIGSAFVGHSSRVTSVAFSPEGDRIVSGGDDRTLRLWALSGRQIGSAFEGNSGGILSVAFSAEGDRIVSGDDDGTLRLWDLAGRQIGSAFEGHGGAVTSVTFSCEGDLLVSGGTDGTVRLWDLAGRQIGSAFEGHQGQVRSVAFSSEGNRLVSGGYDGTLRLWDLAGRQIGDAFEGHGVAVNTVAFSSEGNRLVSGGYDGTLRLWDLDGRQIGGAFKGHSGPVWSVAFSPGGDRIVSASTDGTDSTLRLWDLEGRQISGAFDGHGSGVTSVAFSPGGDRIVSGGPHSIIRLWDLEGRQSGGAFDGHGDMVLTVAFSPTGDRVISGGSDGTLRLWDLEGRQIGGAFEGHRGQVRSVAFMPRGRAHCVRGQRRHPTAVGPVRAANRRCF